VKRDFIQAVSQASGAAAAHPQHALPVMLALLGVLGWMLLWYWPTARGMAGIWWGSETFTHGVAVLPLCAWLVWGKRERLNAQALAPTPWMALPVALAGSAWLLGELVAVNALAHLALVAMTVGVMVGVLGWHLARVLAFPLLFLFFAVPIGEFLMPALMRYTADFTVVALRLSGVPVLQEGLYFEVPNGRWSVVEACSGIRYLIASLMVGTLYAYLSYRSLRRRLIFVAISAAVPIVANWVRAYLIVMLGYLSDNRIAAGVDHLIYGWIFFGVVILLMLAIGSRWREDHLPAPPPAAVPPALPVPAVWRWGALLALALATAAFPLLHSRLAAAELAFEVALPPFEVPGWTRDDSADAGVVPHYIGYRGQLRHSWRRGDEQVTLHLAYYAAQRPERELVMWANRLLAPEQREWRVLEEGRDDMPVSAAAEAVAVRTTVLASMRRERVAVWAWYWMDGRVLTSDVHAKLYKALDRVRGRADDAAYVALLVPVQADRASARRSAEDFLRAAAPGLQASLLAAAQQAARQQEALR
jgi:exosortase A